MAYNFTLREDGSGYVEGATMGDIIHLKILGKTWLIPNVTMTNKPLTDSGQINVPVINRTEQGARTGICEAANTGKASSTLRTLSVDGKVSAEMGGCFTAAGIANREIQKGIDDAQIEIMAKDYEDDYNALVLSSATQSTVDYTGKSNKEQVNALIAEYKFARKERPTYVVMSFEFAEQLMNELSERQTSLGDDVLVNGVFARLNGVLLIEADVPFELAAGSAKGIQQGTPSTIKQVPYMDSVDLSVATDYGFDASNGIVTQTVHPTDGSLGEKTFIHKVYGRLIVPEFIYVKPVTP